MARWQVLALLSCGLFVLVLALPRLTASLWEIRPDAYLDSLTTNKRISEMELQEIKPELQQAISYKETAHAYENLGNVNLQLAKTLNQEPGRRLELLHQAKTALQASLAHACANPYAWQSLAHLEAQIGGKPKDVVDALEMSMLTGRSEAELYLGRINLAFMFYQAADDDARSLIAQQLRLAWKVKRNEVIKLAMQYNKEDVLSSALAYLADD